MNQNKFLPVLVCGFGAAVLSTIPGLKSASCCLFVPLAAALSLVLHQKMNKPEEPYKTGIALLFGFLTGIVIALFSTVFETIITLITHTNEFVEALPQTEAAMRDLNLGPIFDQSVEILKALANEIRTNGFSLFYTVGMLFSNIIINSIFGMIGGMLGLLYVNKNMGR